MNYHKSLNCSDVSCACVFQCFNFSFERVAMLMAILRLKSVWSLSVFSCPSDCLSLSQGTLHTPEEPMLTALEVGSEFKIDCSYLSPNVSIATSIERSTAGRVVKHGGRRSGFVFQSASTKLSLDGWRVWPFHLLVREMSADFPQKYRSQLLWDLEALLLEKTTLSDSTYFSNDWKQWIHRSWSDWKHGV